jgi:hypothetical protein
MVLIQEKFSLVHYYALKKPKTPARFWPYCRLLRNLHSPRASGGRSKCSESWSAKEKGGGGSPGKLLAVHPGDWKYGVLEIRMLVQVAGLWVAVWNSPIGLWTPSLLGHPDHLWEAHLAYPNHPCWSFALKLSHSIPVPFSVVAKYNMWTINHLFCCLRWRIFKTSWSKMEIKPLVVS